MSAAATTTSLSVFDIFSIGLGPSSSHSTGPMHAAKRFVDELRGGGVLADVASVTVWLHGSLALTGKGHGTDKAIVLGLLGEEPHAVEADAAPALLEGVRSSGRLELGGEHEIAFDFDNHLVYVPEQLPRRPNGLRLVAAGVDGAGLHSATYYSIGGGFVVDDEGRDIFRNDSPSAPVPNPFGTAAELMRIAAEQQARISDLVLANECATRSEAEVRAGVLRLWRAMQDCVKRGCKSNEERLPGGLNVRRRAPGLYRQLGAAGSPDDPLKMLDWVNLWAIAVNEENACGGRVVTAPTNGAAGILPAVLHYLEQSSDRWDDDLVVRFFLTAAAIGTLYKLNASISGADVGCQGEVGVACSMAAGALAEALGGTVEQVEMAAEIGMEHNLGLTCDPIGGLVQIPCIERNAMGAVKAINAARMALQGDGDHHVSLDRVIATMKRTGADMSSKYKETSRGGLAVNVIEC